MAEPPHLLATRTAYDTVAVDYAELLTGELAARPLDRAMLAAFTELVRDAGAGPVADLGCGPGRVTAYLHSLGLDCFGVDLSPAMVTEARRRHPGLRFDVGMMSALDRPDRALGGVVAWYSIIHTPPALLPAVFAEFRRVLAPGGHVLLAFQVGDEQVHLEHAYGHLVSLDAYRLDPDRVAALLTETGLATRARLLREPEPPEKVPQSYLVARLASCHDRRPAGERPSALTCRERCRSGALGTRPVLGHRRFK
jgi:SAM-dependent methyltransferase